MTTPLDTKAARAICEAADGYEVSSDGRVFSTKTNWRGHGERELAQHLNSKGYPRVHLNIGGRRKSGLVHRLVAVAFLPPRPSAIHQIRHLNGKCTDNRADNLAWGTAKENAADRAQHGTTATGERNGWSRLTPDLAASIRAESGVPQRAIAKKYGISQRTVGCVLRGERWAA